jgi:uncharacterized membrane protein
MTFNKEKKVQLERMADKATRWIGSTSSIVIHTIFFVIAFALPITGVVTFEEMLLILTTAVSLEAIYLAIFIQMSVNKNSQHIEIIQEDVGEIQEDIQDIEEDIDEIQKDVDEIHEDIEVETLKENAVENNQAATLASIRTILLQLQNEIELLKKD